MTVTHNVNNKNSKKMLNYSKLFSPLARKCGSNFLYFSISKPSEQIAKPILRKRSYVREIGPFGWFLLIVPASTFALGTWQIQRKKWKEDLLADLKTRTRIDPVKLPANLEELEKLEYHPVHVRGHFLHDKEIYLGPRSLIIEGDAATQSALISQGQNKSQGFLVITPFKLSDRDETILVNRGWIPASIKDSKKRKEGQVEGEVDVIGVVRLHENRPNFMPANKEEAKLWFYRDLDQMCRVTGASPIFLDATTDFDVPKGPIGGQTRISLRNEHLSYIVTWYGLCAITSFMWYKKFIKK